ncbi:terminus macrodomain insulation protein YfbV [Cognaticolwellia mytili]|uniref:terminus macrodomain insulation protein YfbV n=1 Tax=Cognaticolwellia mytili TaxID=1888913 RepID=UPI000A172746|nr:terminus macrodomain insulation protein YfbV [Cognaticolwellia mytili]
MKLSVFEIIKLGRKYMHLWPVRAELDQYFVDYQAVKMSRLVCQVMPGLAAFCFVIQLYLGSMTVLPQALLYSLCILSFPLQALMFMGVKADKFLPPALASWYKESVAKVNQSGGEVKLSTQRPRYLDLASLLNLTFQNNHN